MLNQIDQFIKENKTLIILIIVILSIIFDVNKVKENMTDLPSVCTSNKYQLILDNKKVLYLNKIDNQFIDIQTVLPENIEPNNLGNTHFTLHTPGDGNYVIKNSNNLFLSFNKQNDSIIIDNFSKRFKFVDAKTAGIIDAEPGELLLTTEYNSYLVYRDSLHLGYDKEHSINTGSKSLLQGINKKRLNIFSDPNNKFYGVPLFKLKCVN